MLSFLESVFISLIYIFFFKSIFIYILNPIHFKLVKIQDKKVLLARNR